jgi:hypothetical protein
MSVVTNPNSLTAARINQYIEVETELESAMRTCFPAHRIHSCTILSEREMDKIFPPEIRAINQRTAKKRVFRHHDFKEEVDEFLKEDPRFRAEIQKLNKKQYDRLLSFLVRAVESYVLGHEPNMKLGERDLQLEKSPGLKIADLVGALTYNRESSRRAAKDVRDTLQRLVVFTAMGCFADNQVYLCPTRIEMSSAFLDCKPSEVLEIVWIHEEIHAVLQANMGQSIEEHVVQTMTAGVLDKLSKKHLLTTMMHLSKEQPDEYALFSQEPNIDLLSIRNTGAKRRMTLAKSNRQATLFQLPPTIDQGILEKIEEVTGGPAAQIGNGMLRTANGKYILFGVEQNHEWVIDWDLVKGMPISDTYYLLIKDENVFQYVMPIQWLIDNLGVKKKHPKLPTGRMKMKSGEEGGIHIGAFLQAYETLR